jgi:uncharacterized protein (DUF2236 family)
MGFSVRQQLWAVLLWQQMCQLVGMIVQAAAMLCGGLYGSRGDSFYEPSTYCCVM